MGRGVVVGNKALEMFRERLERWDELCSQLRELYYRYLDLAAFRSDKCFFPGRKCKRSWKRQYGLGDLTLMWTYIANTAPPLRQTHRSAGGGGIRNTQKGAGKP